MIEHDRVIQKTLLLAVLSSVCLFRRFRGAPLRPHPGTQRSDTDLLKFHRQRVGNTTQARSRNVVFQKLTLKPHLGTCRCETRSA